MKIGTTVDLNITEVVATLKGCGVVNQGQREIYVENYPLYIIYLSREPNGLFPVPVL